MISRSATPKPTAVFDSLSELPSDDEIATAYLRELPRLERDSGDEPWPVDALRLLVYFDPIRAWRVLGTILRKAPNELLAVVGTGPLEEFIHRHARQYVREIEDAAKDHRFAVALSNVWLSKGQLDPEVEARLMSASGGTMLLLDVSDPDRT